MGATIIRGIRKAMPIAWAGLGRDNDKNIMGRKKRKIAPFLLFFKKEIVFSNIFDIKF